VPLFCHNNGINFFAKLFPSDRVKARGRRVLQVASPSFD
jgi:hypothetical protein